MGRIERLAERYKRYIALPWQKDLSGAQRTLFIQYDPTDERRLRARRTLFELATGEAGHHWIECDLTAAFADWMANLDYRDSYFEAPEDLQLKLDDEFLGHVAGLLRQQLAGSDDQTVLGVYGIASLFGLIRLSDLMKTIEGDVRGRIAVFFPGEYEEGNYRLLDARDGWNYLAVPITAQEA